MFDLFFKGPQTPLILKKSLVQNAIRVVLLLQNCFDMRISVSTTFERFGVNRIYHPLFSATYSGVRLHKADSNTPNTWVLTHNILHGPVRIQDWISRPFFLR